MRPPSLRTRIRNGTLLMLALALGLGAFAVPAVYRLGGTIREVLYRNYTSIEAAQHMHAALYAIQLAQSSGTLAAVLAPNRNLFTHWINVELDDITEVGEADLAGDIQRRGRQIFDELARGKSQGPTLEEFSILHGRLDKLIEMNKAAMFRADSRTTQLSDHLAYEFAAGLLLLLLLGLTLSWTLAWNLSKPLSELSDHLRSFSLRGSLIRLGEQPLAELQAAASGFNRMAERLDLFEKLNFERLLYEQSKTEAILESIEDGIVLIDPKGIVTHINQMAAIILGVGLQEALGSPFDDLDTNHPHYLKVRSALRSLTTQPLEAQRVEVDLRVSGRDHNYILKFVPLRQEVGTILILQDVTDLHISSR